MRTVILLLAFWAISSLASPEAGLCADWSAGFQIGGDLSNSSITGQTPGQYGASTNFGFLVGGQLDYRVNSTWAFEGGLRFDQRSFEGNFNQMSGASYPGTAKMNWLEIPFVAKLKLGNSAGWPYLMSGPEFGLKLSESDSGFQSPPFQGSTGDVMRSFEFSWIFGVGVPFQLGHGREGFASAAYVPGLNNLWSGNTTGGNEISAVLSGFLLSVGMNFPIHL